MKKKILYTVLNWGLGHASRSIPIIQKLLKENNEIIIASDGDALRLLEITFPTLQFLTLPAYNIRYPTKNMLWNLVIQSKKFYTATRQEHIITQQFVIDNNIDEIISDNRFGCYSPLVKKNIFVTHQVNILSPIAFLSPLASFVNQYFIKRFDEIWIPDEADEKKSLAGKLSHGNFEHLPPLKYIGVQTRLQVTKTDGQSDFFSQMPLGEKKVAVILSGPEPQRRFLSDELFEKAAPLTSISFVFVQGLPQQYDDFFPKKNIRNISFLNTEDLNNLVLEADVIITRSGYSTLMDLKVLGKETLLIPTPGQTEQIYLAEKCTHLEGFYTQKQGKINLEVFFKKNTNV
jgi:Glycosyltransferase family 28 C-terminal domain